MTTFAATVANALAALTRHFEREFHIWELTSMDGAAHVKRASHSLDDLRSGASTGQRDPLVRAAFELILALELKERGGHPTREPIVIKADGQVK
jgi:hypothetical protein